MKKYYFLLVFLIFNILIAQQNLSNHDKKIDALGVNKAKNWTIPRDKVLSGGPGKDDIPALDNPKLVIADDVYGELQDADLVLGFKNGEIVRAYPRIILDWHEIINDNIGDISLAVTYCPLTGTGIGWNRIIEGSETTFGVSGLLYQTNLIPFDRATGSNWSQILNSSVNGDLIGTNAETIPLIETNWKTWRMLYPKTEVVSLDTGYNRTYGTSPYGDYNSNDNLFIFPTPKDARLPSKERVHTIIDQKFAKAYRFSDFKNANLIKDKFLGKKYLIVGNQNFITSFELNKFQNDLNFSYIFDGRSDAILQDSQGNQWNIFGEIIAGSKGPLKVSTSFMGFWFSISAFYETTIFRE